MRRVAAGQNFFRYPLNELLGREAHVRVLRVLATEVSGPVSMSDMARRAKLTLPGLQKAIGRLVDSGILAVAGGGRRQQYMIRESDPLAQAILTLFETEKKRYEKFILGLRIQIEKLSYPPSSAWVQKLPSRAGDNLQIGILHEPKHLDTALSELRKGLVALERKYDLTIELNGYSRGELPDFAEDAITLVFGVPPETKKTRIRASSAGTTHQAKDDRVLVLSRGLAAQVACNPSLVRRAREHVVKLIKEEQGMANKDLMEWKEILDSYSLQRLLRFLTASSERAARLRQSNPFFAVLDSAERKGIDEAGADSQ